MAYSGARSYIVWATPGLRLALAGFLSNKFAARGSPDALLFNDDYLRGDMSRPRTLYEKIWDDHTIVQRDDGAALIFIDRHLVHEVTSPQAFAGLRAQGRKLRRPDLTLAVPDHNICLLYTSRLFAAL